MARRLTGWLVAVAYAMAGARRRVVRMLKAGAALPVVVHAMPAWQLEKILAWLKANGVLDRLWLTFDDGWSQVKDYVPILEKYGVKAKLFIAPGETMRGNVWTHAAIMTGVPAPIWRSWYNLSEAERYRMLETVQETISASACTARSLLTKDEVISLSKHPLISIENHTWSHLSATHRPVDEVLDEIRRAQVELIVWTGRVPEYVAWPFGRGNKELDVRVKELGLTPVYTRQGYEEPCCRNMAIEDVSFQENLGRVLGAWPKVGETL